METCGYFTVILSFSLDSILKTKNNKSISANTGATCLIACFDDSLGSVNFDQQCLHPFHPI